MLFATKLNSSCSGRNVPRVGNVRSPLKRREFRLELAESRRIVPEWTGTRTLGRRRGSRGGARTRPPRRPPSFVAAKADPPGDPPRGIAAGRSWVASVALIGLRLLIVPKH